MMLLLRDVADSDLDVFFEHWADDDALRMAAFTPADAHDRAAFEARWARQRTTATILAKTIELDGEPVGSISSWDNDGKREVTYWIGRAHWGKGIASRALGEFPRDRDDAAALRRRRGRQHRLAARSRKVWVPRYRTRARVLELARSGGRRGQPQAGLLNPAVPPHRDKRKLGRWRWPDVRPGQSYTRDRPGPTTPAHRHATAKGVTCPPDHSAGSVELADVYRPNRCSVASSRRQRGFTFTWSSR